MNNNIKIDWDNVDTVLLDMDGTLLDLHFDSFFWKQHLPLRYSEIHRAELSNIATEIRNRLEEKQGRLEWYCTDYWSRQFNLDIIAAQEEVKHLIVERPQALKFLDILGGMQKKRILITNSDRASINLKFSMTSIEPLLDLVISSHDYAIAKEQQQFWIELQRKVPFNPSKTLFIDDSEPVLNAAKTFGIKHIYGIDRPDSTQLQASQSQFPTIDQFLTLL